MTDKIEELIERLRQLEVRITMDANETCGQAADALAALRTQRNEVIEECARLCDVEADTKPIYDAYSAESVHRGFSYLATAIRNLKNQDEPR